MKRSGIALIIVSALWLLATGCSKANQVSNVNTNSTLNRTNITQNTEAQVNSIAPQKTSDSPNPNFAIDVICDLPKQVAPNTPFASLGGGTWGKWSQSGGELDYGCNGGKDSIKLINNGSNDITAEYTVVGGAQVAHQVSAEYTATQYNKDIPSEKRMRQQYADFVDKLSEKFYGVKLPENFRKRLLDESKYSTTDTANEYAEKVGNGYVNLSSSKNKTSMIMLDVHFFSSQAEYEKYKDS
jgi:hypothetical protein